MNEAMEELFEKIELSTAPFLICELDGVTQMEIAPLPQLSLHLVLQGAGTIELAGLGQTLVSPGSLVLVPALQPHMLVSAEADETHISEYHGTDLNITRRTAKGGKRGGMLVLCSSTMLGFGNNNDVSEIMITPMVMRKDLLLTIEPIYMLVLREMANCKVGSAAMIRSFLRICLIAFLRDKIESEDPGIKQFVALKESRLRRALISMVKDLGADHSVESLAAEAGMSRSRFAALFTITYSIGPMEFLRNMRINRAAYHLTIGREPITRLAGLVGFKSRSAFSTAFKKQMGLSPQKYQNRN